MDDRLPLAAMTLLLERLDPAALTHELWFVATVQEETGLHGARTVAAHASFDQAIALDVEALRRHPDRGLGTTDHWPASVAARRSSTETAMSSTTPSSAGG